MKRFGALLLILAIISGTAANDDLTALSEKLFRAFFAGDFATLKANCVKNHPLLTKPDSERDEADLRSIRHTIEVVGPLQKVIPVATEEVTPGRIRVVADLEFAKGTYQAIMYFRNGNQYSGINVPLVGPGLAIPDLTNEQMRQDFDAMVAVLKETMPHAEVIRQSTGSDVWLMLADYRARIPADGNSVSFAKFLRRVLADCRGHHLWLADLDADEHFREIYRGLIDFDRLGDNRLAQHLAWRYSAAKEYPNPLELSYLQGNYYNDTEFTFKGIKYPAAMKLVEIDGKTPDELARNAGGRASGFDFRRQKPFFAGGNLIRYLTPSVPGQRTFVFVRPDGEKVVLTFKEGERVECSGNPKGYFFCKERVIYLEDTNLIFIRLPAMNPERLPEYEKAITEIMTGHRPRYAVIDIRNNGGGSDRVPSRLLELLAGFPVKYQLALALPANDRLREHMRRRGPVTGENAVTREIPFLGAGDFDIYEAGIEFKPDGSRPGVEHIYVLVENIYSAAGTLTAIAAGDDHITSVGVPGDKILGRGIDPYVFQLPNSKLLVQVEPAIDISNARSASDCLHNGVEVEIAPFPEAYFAMYAAPAADDIKRYLRQDDPFMAKVFELIKERENRRNHQPPGGVQ